MTQKRRMVRAPASPSRSAASVADLASPQLLGETLQGALVTAAEHGPDQRRGESS